MEFTSSTFYRFINEKKLMGSKCKFCGTLFLPPRPICLNCHHNKMEWTQLSGKGKLKAYTTIAIGPTFMLKKGYDRKNHYCSGIVELEEGLGISALILGMDTKKPENIKIGTSLEIDFSKIKTENKIISLVFRVRE